MGTSMGREQRLVETLVELADTLVDTYDVIDFLQMLSERCVELLDVSAAGIMLADKDAQLRHAACSDEQMRLVELFELQLAEGPCFDAYRQGASSRCGTIEEAQARWPHFAARGEDGGYVAFSAVPLRLRDQVIGALNMFSQQPGSIGDADLIVGQALADMATIGVLQARAIRDARDLSAHLETALDSRVAIEQAKGIIAEHQAVNVDDAFGLLRTYARNHNRLLSEAARQIIDGSLPVTELATARSD